MLRLTAGWFVYTGSTWRLLIVGQQMIAGQQKQVATQPNAGKTLWSKPCDEVVAEKQKMLSCSCDCGVKSWSSLCSEI